MRNNSTTQRMLSSGCGNHTAGRLHNEATTQLRNYIRAQRTHVAKDFPLGNAITRRHCRTKTRLRYGHSRIDCGTPRSKATTAAPDLHTTRRCAKTQHQINTAPQRHDHNNPKKQTRRLPNDTTTEQRDHTTTEQHKYTTTQLHNFGEPRSGCGAFRSNGTTQLHECPTTQEYGNQHSSCGPPRINKISQRRKHN